MGYLIEKLPPPMGTFYPRDTNALKPNPFP